jgi:ABC-2 type transport system ATP-binding protein
VLTTVRRPDGGTVRIFGNDVCEAPTAAHRWLGVVFQEPTLDPDLSVEGNLWFHARLFGMSRAQAQSRIAAMLTSFGLAERARDDAGDLSGGLARRVEVARALLHAPGLVILDEPTAGLDPGTRRLVWDDLRRLRRDAGVAVLYSTHYMDEAELADEIVILNEGRVVRRGTPAELKADLALSSIALATCDDAGACTRLAAAGFDATLDDDDGVVFVRCDHPERHVAVVVGAAGADVRWVEVRHAA